jgi:hypothetical protein
MKPAPPVTRIWEPLAIRAPFGFRQICHALFTCQVMVQRIDFRLLWRIASVLATA